eukprot:gene24991-biopygen14997
MGPEVGPAFQRRSRATLSFLLGVRLAETAEVGQYSTVWEKERVDPCFFFLHFGRGITYKIRVLAVFALFAFFCHGWEQDTWELRPSRRDPDRRTRALRARK